MPELVLSWSWSKNVSLTSRADKNRGMQYIVVVNLRDEAGLAEYLPHPEHLAVKEIQSSIVEDIIPLDAVVDEALFSSDAPLAHIVALKFKDDLSHASLEQHFVQEVKLKERMPDIVHSWAWSKNVSLSSRADKNRGMQYVVLVNLKDEAALEQYIPHPEHLAVKEIQRPMVEDIVPLDAILSV
eukprot:gnl/TRDRNA2_/TRDRNA2_168459_c0_seq4.p1 gnl/TRDRNA2_/TRDRNA2_168459_c0~~gnl/TRDRNA2_/TRDRNA2_168459_c0_seq4.p1  ORF type:complete len:184 (+),score=39.35 gnl/TRDRNA2_/TRDRNA2_168459_c0_seq4:259-810(+)